MNAGISLGTTFPLTTLILLVLISLAMIVLASTAVQKGRPRSIAIILRSLSFALVFILLLRPSFISRIYERVRSPIAVVVDRSLSMTLPIEKQNTRWNELSHFLHSSWWDRFQDDFDLSFYEFSKDVIPTTLDALRVAESPKGLETNIDGVLDQLLKENKFKGILILTDGVNSGGLRGREKALVKADLPVVALVSSSSENIRDVAITDIKTPEFAYVKNKLSIEVELAAIGIPENDFKVRLRSQSRLLTEEIIPRSLWTEGRATVMLTFVPEKLGPLGLIAEISEFPGEVSTDNNRRFATLQVLLDRSRVLHVAGRPDWDERFLRGFLKENPNMDLISFFILRSPFDNPEAHQSELSLIPFPYQDLFTKELHNFDIVIFQNFDFRSYFSPFYLSNLQDFVEKGGGFMMIGGNLSFGRGGYDGTPLESILPVQVRSDSGEISLGSFKPNLTRESRFHPITRNLREQDLTGLPELSGYHRVESVVPDAVMLLAHPTEKLSGKPAPVLLARNVGKGRVAALLVDSLWKWAFNDRGGHVYADLWNKIYPWLIQDPFSSYLRLLESNGELVVTVLRQDYSPWKGIRPRIELSREGSKILDEILPETNEIGEVRFKSPSGKTLLEATVSLPGKENAGYILREIISPYSETSELDFYGVDEKRMREWALQTEGEVFRIRDVPSQLEPFERRVIKKEVGSIEKLIWDQPVLLVLLLLVICTEWIYRRRNGAA